MRRTMFAFFAVAVLAAGVALAENGKTESPTPKPSASPTPTVLPSLPPERISLIEGEKHTYEITWKNIAAGTGTIEVVRREKGPGGPWYLLHMTAESSKLVSVFYRVKDLFVSHMDAREGFTRRFERHLREGKNFREETVIYDYKAGEIRYTTKKKPTAKVKNLTFPLKGPILDPLAAVFYVRTLDMKVGDRIRLPVHSNEEDWVLTLDVVGLVRLRMPGIGKFNAWKVKPRSKEDALFTAKGAMTVWFEKTTKVILKSEVTIPIGTVVIRMIRAENSPLERVNRRERRRRWIRPATKEMP